MRLRHRYPALAAANLVAMGALAWLAIAVVGCRLV